MLTLYRFQDFAFVLEGDGFKWRWETNLAGPKLSARLLSQHLIMPLISTIHLAFTSPDPLPDMAERELEKVCATFRLPFPWHLPLTHEIDLCFSTENLTFIL